MHHKPKLNEGAFSYRGRSVELTRSQFLMAERLVERWGRYVTWRDLYVAVIGRDPDKADVGLLAGHMYLLRKRLREAEIGVEIQNRRQFGFRMVRM